MRIKKILMEQALSAIQPCLSNKFLGYVVEETTTAKLCIK